MPILECPHHPETPASSRQIEPYCYLADRLAGTERDVDAGSLGALAQAKLRPEARGQPKPWSRVPSPDLSSFFDQLAGLAVLVDSTCSVGYRSADGPAVVYSVRAANPPETPGLGRDHRRPGAGETFRAVVWNGVPAGKGDVQPAPARAELWRPGDRLAPRQGC